jgi:hypothetical protein
VEVSAGRRGRGALHPSENKIWLDELSRGGHAAEVYIEVLGLDAPVRGPLPLDTAADNRTEHFRGPLAASTKRKESRRIIFVLKVVRRGLHTRPRDARGRVDEGARATQNPSATTNGTEGVDPVCLCIRLVHRKAGKVGVSSHARKRGAVRVRLGKSTSTPSTPSHVEKML